MTKSMRRADNNAIILSIETSEKNCSVAISNNDKILFFSQLSLDYSHDRSLHALIQETLKHTQLTFQQLDAIAVSKGPGSYTGLRIGVSAAKGLAYTLDIPLIGISTLKAMSLPIISMQSVKSHHYFCPMIDARRLEVNTAVYDEKINTVLPPAPIVLEENVFGTLFKLDPNVPITIFGSGSDKSIELVSSYFKSYTHLKAISCNADSIALLAYKKYKNKSFENITHFHPAYLKPFFTNMKINNH